MKRLERIGFGFFIVLLLAMLVYAYGGTDPAVHGHDVGELAIADGTIEGNLTLNGALKGDVRVYDVSEGESYYSSGLENTKLSINLGPGTWLITVGYDIRAEGTGSWWQWRLRDTTSGTDLIGAIQDGSNWWEQEMTSHTKSKSFTKVYSVDSGIHNIAVQFRGASYPVRVSRASIAAIRLA